LCSQSLLSFFSSRTSASAQSAAEMLKFGNGELIRSWLWIQPDHWSKRRQMTRRSQEENSQVNQLKNCLCHCANREQEHKQVLSLNQRTSGLAFWIVEIFPIFLISNKPVRMSFSWQWLLWPWLWNLWFWLFVALCGI
jgi:hypothetical protein